MAQTTFSGPVRSLRGFVAAGPDEVVNITAETTLTFAAHAGKVKVAAPATLWYNILPACVSTVKEVAPAPIDTEFPVPTP